MKKKFLSLALALAICLGLSIPTMAADTVELREGIALTGVVGEEMLPDSPVPLQFCKVEFPATLVISGCGQLDEYGYSRKASIWADIYEAVQNGPDEPADWNWDNGPYIPGKWVSGDHIAELEWTENGIYTFDQSFAGKYVFLYISETWESTDTPGGGNGLPSAGTTEVLIQFPDNADSNQSVQPSASVEEPPAEPEKPPISPAPAAGTLKFSDVSSDSWYAESVQWAVDQGITTGTSDTAFSPNDNCTHAQILTFLWRSQGQPEPALTESYSFEVSSNDYYYKAVLWAEENNLFAHVFNKDLSKECTRQETVLYLWSLAGHPSSSSISFTDVPAGSAQYVAVGWAVENGITTGTSGTTFSPNGTCTRAEIVTFLYRNFAE